METLKKLSLFMCIPPSLTLAYDLIFGWFVKAEFEIRSLKKWWDVIHKPSYLPVKNFVGSITSTSYAEKMFSMPAPFVLGAIPLFLYVVYRIIFLLAGGKAGGYKSRH